MKYLITFILCFTCVFIQAQISLRFHLGSDKISLQNEPTVDWTITEGRTVGVKCTYPLKYFDVGLLAYAGFFTLNRPNYEYSMENSWFGITFSKGIKNKKKNLEFRGDIYPYVRFFDTEFYSASLILDSHNYGVGMDMTLYWIVTKKFSIGIGYTFKTDFHGVASRLEEVTNKDRFALLNMHSFSVNFGYNFNLKRNKKANPSE